MLSGEAVLYALTKVAAQMLGLISMAADFGKAPGAKSTPIPQQRWAWCSGPAWAERDICVCSTCGSNRKCKTKNWLLRRWTENVADLMMKSLSAEVATYFMEKFGICRADGRSNLTPEIALMTSGEVILRTAPFLKRHWSVEE